MKIYIYIYILKSICEVVGNNYLKNAYDFFLSFFLFFLFFFFFFFFLTNCIIKRYMQVLYLMKSRISRTHSILKNISQHLRDLQHQYNTILWHSVIGSNTDVSCWYSYIFLNSARHIVWRAHSSGSIERQQSFLRYIKKKGKNVLII